VAFVTTIVTSDVTLAAPAALNVIVWVVAVPTQPAAKTNEKTAESVVALIKFGVGGVIVSPVPVGTEAVTALALVRAVSVLIARVTAAAGPVEVSHLTVTAGPAVSAAACREPMQTVNASNARKIGTR
jgi:hypothetical protein